MAAAIAVVVCGQRHKAKASLRVLEDVASGLASCGLEFRFHAVWRALSPVPPHTAVIHSLARALHVSLDMPGHGYCNAHDFEAEIHGWQQWYAVTRRTFTADPSELLSRVSRLRAAMHGMMF